MPEVLALFAGFLAGLAWTRCLGRAIGALARRPARRALLIVAGPAHLLPIGVLLALVAARSPGLAAALLAGYWWGRTAWLLRAIGGQAEGGCAT